MNTQSKSNILDYSDRTIFARVKSESEPTATYYFTSEDSTSLEAVTFDLRGGSVTATAVIPKNYFVQDSTIQYFTNGSAVSGCPCSGVRS